MLHSFRAPKDSSPKEETKGSKLLQKKDRKSKQFDQIDRIDLPQTRERCDSFERFYNKDLDLEEDQVPVVVHELCESAINFIS